MTLASITPTADYLTSEQVAQLLRAINPLRVQKDGKNHSHVQAYEVRAHLNRILGFARWSEELTDVTLIFETGETRWTVCYRATIRVTICAPNGRQLAVYTEASTGSGINQPSRSDAHDLALKTAQSQAFKRCMVNLGDQFGNSLYGAGSVKALTGRTLLMPEVRAAAEGIDDEAVKEPVPAESEQVEDKREKNAPKATPQPRENCRQPALDALREQALNPPADVNAQWWAKLQLDATKAKVLNALTADANGVEMSLAALIQAQMRRVAA